MVENVALIDLSEAPRVLLRLLGASRLSLSRRGTGLIDPVSGRPSDLYRIAVRGDLGEQASREVFTGLIEGSDAKESDPITPERLVPRHKSLRSDDYLFECSPFEDERAAGPIAPVARGQVEGAFLEAGEGQIASRTCGLSATLDLYRSARLDDRLSDTRTDPGGNGALVQTAFCREAS